MIERSPVQIQDAQMERNSIEQYQRAMPQALRAINAVTTALDEREAGGIEREMVLPACRDGKKETYIVDDQVLKAMKGGMVGMYEEFVHVGLKPMADLYIRSSKEPENNVNCNEVGVPYEQLGTTGYEQD